MTYTVGTLFSGIGVPDLCARLLGMTTVWQVEKEAFPQAVLRKNFPEAMLYGDIFDCHSLPYVDLIVAGFPCQPFSGAGKRQGERDPRYLVPEMLRVIDECRPRVCLLENVPGFASLDDGQSFKRLLGALAEMGLDAEWGHIRASDVGAPHQRERWWLVAYAVGDGARNSGRRGALRDGNGNRAETEHGRDKLKLGTVASSRSDVGNATSGGDRRRYETGGDRRWADTPEWERVRHESGGDGQLGNASSVRQGKLQSRDEARFASPVNSSTQLVNASGARCEGYSSVDRMGTQFAWVDDTGVVSPTAGAREAQPGLGRVLDGLAGGVDGFVPYPARPGQPQHAYEPPRTTTRNDHRPQRLKALGNSMAVDVVFEIMLAIRTWLETEAAHG